MTLDELMFAEQRAWIRYQEAQKVADQLNAEWSVAFAAYRDEFNATPITAMQWIRSEGIAMFGEVN